MKIMVIMHFIFFIIVISLYRPSNIYGNEFGPIHYIWEGTYALENNRKDFSKPHRVATYLPPTTLVFLKKRMPKKISGKDYKFVVTQHGQKLLVHDETISDKSFLYSYGRQNIIFHQNSHMCHEDDKDCDEGIDITRGNVLELLEKGTYVKLKKVIVAGKTKKEVIGYLHKTTFENFLDAGILTDASKQYPRYKHFSTQQISSLSTECGKKRKEIDLSVLSNEVSLTISPTGFIPWLKDIFSIEAKVSAKKEKQNVIEVSYGGDDIAIDYFVITILEPDNDGNFSINQKRTFNIYAKIKCIMPSGLKIYIDNLTINEGKEFAGMLSFESINGAISSDGTLNERSKPYKIYKKNGASYFLTSINSYKHYEKALMHWVEQFEDVSLAHILMTEFNVSCPEKDKNGRLVRKKCIRDLPIP